MPTLGHAPYARVYVAGDGQACAERAHSARNLSHSSFCVHRNLAPACRHACGGRRGPVVSRMREEHKLVAQTVSLADGERGYLVERGTLTRAEDLLGR
ncbi:hypothetical protein MTO96_049704 [Rhipicephalus appendiculatus]